LQDPFGRVHERLDARYVVTRRAQNQGGAADRIPAGLVAERYDGYAVVRDAGAPADVQALVDQVNAERRALYQERAAVEGAPVEEVGKVYARQIMSAAPAGTWFLGEDGNWVQK